MDAAQIIRIMLQDGKTVLFDEDIPGGQFRTVKDGRIPLPLVLYKFEITTGLR